jgi:hypothetical protein
MTKLKTEIVNPTMERANALEPGTVFFKRRDSGIYIVAQENCFTKRILEKEAVTKNPVIIFSLTLNLILTIDGEEWVILANDAKITAHV